MKTRDYIIHDKVKFQIKNSTNTIKNYFDTTQIQFQNYLSDNCSPYDFTVEIGAFSREKRSCTIIDDTYYIADGYIYFKDKRKLSRWEVEINEIEGLPRVRISTNIAGSITIPLNIIEFLIQYSLLRKGISVIHASGVGRSDKCVIFPARSGVGKTTLALSLLNKGFLYMGDNYIILDKGKAKNYICPLNIFTYNRLPVIEKNLSPKQRLSMLLKKGLYTVTRGYFKIFEKINPVTLFKDSIVNNLPVYLICVLERNCALSENKLIIKDISKRELIKKLRYNMELDLIPFSKCVYSYGYMFTDSIFSRFWEIYEERLENNLPEDASFISIEVPTTWHENAVNKIIDLVKFPA